MKLLIIFALMGFTSTVFALKSNKEEREGEVRYCKKNDDCVSFYEVPYYWFTDDPEPYCDEEVGKCRWDREGGGGGEVRYCSKDDDCVDEWEKPFYWFFDYPEPHCVEEVGKCLWDL